MTNSNQPDKSFENFLNVIKRLRAPDGCPWDKEQIPLSLRSDLIEEVFEAAEAISDNDIFHTKEELGDVMLNATMIAYMHEQKGMFTVSEVLGDVSEKLVRRHPHVFKESEGASQMNGEVKDSAQVLNQWDAIKRNVEGRDSSSVLDEVPKGFPPLLRACKLQKKAAKQGFDWKDYHQVESKVKEELEEVQMAANELYELTEKERNAGNPVKPFNENSNPQIDSAQLHLEEEIGDLLFSVVNLARHLKVDPSVALERTNQKFCKRFKFVEQSMKDAGIPMTNDNLEQMDSFWDKAKLNEV